MSNEAKDDTRKMVAHALERAAAAIRNGADLSGFAWVSDSPDGFEHENIGTARSTAEAWCDPPGYEDEWPEDMERTSWGLYIAVERAVMVDREDTPEGPHDYSCNYALQPVAAPPSDGGAASDAFDAITTALGAATGRTHTIYDGKNRGRLIAMCEQQAGLLLDYMGDLKQVRHEAEVWRVLAHGSKKELDRWREWAAVVHNTREREDAETRDALDGTFEACLVAAREVAAQRDAIKVQLGTARSDIKMIKAALAAAERMQREHDTETIDYLEREVTDLTDKVSALQAQLDASLDETTVFCMSWPEGVDCIVCDSEANGFDGNPAPFGYEEDNGPLFHTVTQALEWMTENRGEECQVAVGAFMRPYLHDKASFPVQFKTVEMMIANTLFTSAFNNNKTAEQAASSSDEPIKTLGVDNLEAELTVERLGMLHSSGALSPCEYTRAVLAVTERQTGILVHVEVEP